VKAEKVDTYDHESQRADDKLGLLFSRPDRCKDSRPSWRCGWLKTLR
jgi:hypothetical protein